MSYEIKRLADLSDFFIRSPDLTINVDGDCGTLIKIDLPDNESFHIRVSPKSTKEDTYSTVWIDTIQKKE